MSKNNSGIYYIQNTVTQQLYIGQSIDLTHRLNTHFNFLRKNKHFNKHLQNSFNKYGEENFKSGVLQYCDKSELDELEIHYISLYDTRKNGFNIREGGVDAPIMERIKIDDKLLKKLYLLESTSEDLALMFKCSPGTINSRLKEIFSEEELEILNNKKRYDGNTARIDFDDGLLEELYLKGYSCVEIGKIYDCGHNPVAHRMQNIFGEEWDVIKKTGKNNVKQELSDNAKYELKRINLKKELRERQLKINELYEQHGLTDEILEKQVEINTLRHRYNITDESKVIFHGFVQ
ncbi:MAG: GIY-YIG nuclease family protein [Methanobrevibacter sp.]|uniref:GIY-YIG nuclease family protein n=1 Tax=Methanobrevibacter sp. TaxID=66852 RepID=UPI002E77AD52|nr:GIY-YIG nuclease family protein [Methanobrevibacter sp.]MEE0943398.1 GIY-YIG nuclease family protein [Methanobrevibacter sp.]